MDNGGRVMEKFAMDKMRGDRPYFAHGGIARKHNARMRVAVPVVGCALAAQQRTGPPASHATNRLPDCRASALLRGERATYTASDERAFASARDDGTKKAGQGPPRCFRREAARLRTPSRSPWCRRRSPRGRARRRARLW